MRNFLALLFLSMSLGIVKADAPAAPVGIIILKAIAGYDAAATWFVSIQWVDRSGGYVVDPTGAKTAFVNEAIGRIFYFDENYYAEIDHNQYWVDWRAGVQSREVVLPPIDTTNLRPEDSRRLGSEQAAFEDVIERYGNSTPVIQPLIDKLKDQIAKLANGLVLQNGMWVAAKDAAVVESSVPVVGDAESFVTFTTKDGKRFENAKVTVTDTGLSVLTPDGGASVTFDRLPGNLAAFPKTIQEKIIDWRTNQPAVVAANAPPAAAAPTGFLAWIEATYHYVANATYAYFVPAKALGSNDSAPPTPPVPPQTTPAVTVQPAPPGSAAPAPDATALNNLGMAKRDQGDLNGALAYFNQAIATDPNLAVAYDNRGMIKRDKGAFDDAIADFNKAISLDANLGLAYDNRGLATLNEGDPQGAIADFNRALVLNPQDSVAYCNRGFAKYTLKDLDGALADENQAVSLNPSNAKAYNNRGLIRHDKGDQDGAIADFNKALALDPKLASAYNSRGLAEQAKGDVHSAVTDFKQALSLNPHDAKAKDALDALKSAP